MSGADIDFCDSLELVSFIAKETEFYCDFIKNDCSKCYCRYDGTDSTYKCRKEHLLKRKEELERGV